MTLKAHRLISNARIITYPAPDDGESFARSIAADAIRADAREIPIVVPMRVERFPAQAVYDKAAEDIGAALAAGHDVVTLCEGDPFFYGSFMYLFERLSPRFACEIVPGVTSLTACAARLQRPLTARNDVLTVIPGPLSDDEIRPRIEAAGAVAIMKVGRHLDRLTRLLDDMGLLAHAGYVERATLASEKVMPLADIPRRVAAALPGATLHGLAHRVPGLDASFAETLNHIRTLYQAGTPIIGICASGILIRALAAVISDKRLEPPVLAVSEDGASVIPLLGGHRGANSLARQVAEALDGHAAITTAGDTALGIALDSPPAGWWLANPEHAKSFMAELLAGSAVRIEGNADWIARSRLAISDKADLTICLTEKRRAPDDRTLVYHPRRLVVGVGCARGCDPQELATLVRETLAAKGLAEGAVALVATLDLKADEPAMNALADALKVPLRVFDAATLEGRDAPTANAVGGRLRVAKRKTANATVAVAEAPAPLKPAEIGRARGRLSVIGIGPGRDDWRTPQSSRLLAEADEIVGYSLYLDLVAPLIQGKPRHAFPLGAEEERVRFALERAGEGRSVALVSSGDAGIYAMGALVFELLDRPVTDGGVSDAARRIEVINAPGISALQAVSALIGAPLGHDFCTISLSDLLTPWEAIEQRLKAAAEGDFVIAFYNPVSKRRRTQLAAAREILLAHRPADTPVVLGVNLGREGETVRVTTLEALTVDEVDMLTTVLVGSSASRAVMTGAGKPFVYTPRGYAKRIEEKL
eukprot:jgi/Tetstr1/446429/TSEL_033971.t1